MPDFIIKSGDTRPRLEATLKLNGTALDLTSCTVKFTMKNSASGSVLINKETCQILPGSGIVAYDWPTGSTNIIGDFNAEFEVTDTLGSVITFPNNSYVKVRIKEDLD